MQETENLSLQDRCKSYLEKFEQLFDQGVINVPYYSNMKYYLKVIQMFSINKRIENTLKKNLDDVDYTLRCIYKGLAGEKKFNKPSRIIGILNKVSSIGNYDKYKCIVECHHNSEIS